MMSDALLAVENLAASYGGGDVIRDVSLEVTHDETLCLLGRNGMGKTTTLKAIMNHLPPTDGRVRFRGEDITDEPVSNRVAKGIGYVAQEGGFFPSLTVRENLEVSRTKTLTNEDLDELYGIFPKLETLETSIAGNLSGGERQMLKIGKAVLNQPDLLLLDEITEGLQPSLVKDLGTKLNELQSSRSLSILLVEQNVPFCETVGDRFLFIEEGKIQASITDGLAENDELVERYIGPYSESMEI
jgi:ABC-type branched-subunit amino acid transport system ATPase component